MNVSPTLIGSDDNNTLIAVGASVGGFFVLLVCFGIYMYINKTEKAKKNIIGSVKKRASIDAGMAVPTAPGLGVPSVVLPTQAHAQPQYPQIPTVESL